MIERASNKHIELASEPELRILPSPEEVASAAPADNIIEGVFPSGEAINQPEGSFSSGIPFEVNGKIIKNLFPNVVRDEAIILCETPDFQKIIDTATEYASTECAMKVSYDQFKGMYRIEILDKARPVNSMNAKNNALSGRGIDYRNDEFLQSVAESILDISEMKFLKFSGKPLSQELRGAEILEVGPYGSGGQTLELLKRYPGIAFLHMVELDPNNFLQYLPSLEKLPRPLRAKLTLECGDCCLANAKSGEYGMVFINNVLVELFYSHPELVKKWLTLALKVKDGGLISGINDQVDTAISKACLKVLGKVASPVEGEAYQVDTVISRAQVLRGFIELELKSVA